MCSGYQSTLLYYPQYKRFVVASMNLDMVTVGMIEGKSQFAVRLPREVELKETPDHVLVQYEQYTKVRSLYARRQTELQIPSESLTKFVIVWTRLLDGRWVEIALTVSTCIQLANSRNSEECPNVDYRTRFYLGESVKFTDFLLPLEKAKFLEGKEEFLFSKS